MEIHIFEPSSVNLAKLRERFFSDNSIHVVGKALSDSAGAATLHSNTPGSGLGSLAKRRLDHFNIDFELRESVTTLRFETYWKDALRSRCIDLVKFDIEGHELSALHGMGDALHCTRAVQFEFGGCNIDTRTYFQDFWYFFTEHNFDIYRMSPIGLVKIDGYHESLECFLTSNYLAINRNFPSNR